MSTSNDNSISNNSTYNSNSSKGKIKVIVRIRPLLQHEGSHTKKLLTVNKNQINVTVPDNVNDTNSNRGNSNGSGNNKCRSFKFNTVYKEDANQDDIFHNTVPELIENILNGYHATIFAYGQTGSGKTYTMEGYEYNAKKSLSLSSSSLKENSNNADNVQVNFSNMDERRLGITPRAIKMLFNKINNKKR